MNAKTPHILLIEDEPHLAAGIAENLQAEGYTVEIAEHGRAGLQRMRTNLAQLVILDVMLPEFDGFTVCELARAQGIDTPVLFLTAKSEVSDRVRGLKAGGDDYLTKPFHLEELLLRVAAILRRTPSASSGEVRFSGNRVNLDSYQATDWRGDKHQLSHKEAMILKTLIEAGGAVVSRDRILNTVWGHDAFPTARTIDNFVVRLRRRFERDPDNPVILLTVRGVGYRLVIPE